MLNKKYSGHRNPSCTKQRRNLRVESSDEQHELLTVNGLVKLPQNFIWKIMARRVLQDINEDDNL